MRNNLKTEMQQSFQSTLTTITTFMQQAKHLAETLVMAEALADTFRKGRKVLVCGNGGSACQAMHFAEELTGRYRKDRKPLPALSLTDISHTTCVANDYGFEFIFSRAIEAYAQEGDALLLLSTSGNSPNLLRAVTAAKQHRVATHALLGKGGGQLVGICDYEMIAPGATSDEVQNIHMLVVHLLIEAVERQLFPENYSLVRETEVCA